MKTLYLLRHAKSDWNKDAEDHERPLNARGRSACKTIGKIMAAEGIAPERVLCSTARRTTETWQRIQQVIGREFPTEHVRKLYLATPGEMLKLLAKLPDEVASVMLIGHNPGMEQLAKLLCQGKGEPVALQQLAKKYPTAGLAVLRGEVKQWGKLSPGDMALRTLVVP